jgi:hypothetical protein
MKLKMNLKSMEEFNSLLQVASTPTLFPAIVAAAPAIAAITPAVPVVARATPRVARAMRGGQDFDDPISLNQSIDTTGLSIKELISLRNQFA